MINEKKKTHLGGVFFGGGGYLLFKENKINFKILENKERIIIFTFFLMQKKNLFTFYFHLFFIFQYVLSAIFHRQW